MAGLHKYAGQKVRQRGSSPKFQALNSAFITSQSELSFDQSRGDQSYWGRLVKSAVGAHLCNGSVIEGATISYWRQEEREVDFVAQKGRSVVAIEVKSGHAEDAASGLEYFSRHFPRARPLTVGTGGIPLEQFLSRPMSSWIA